jgi:hypothetical protein
MKKLLPLLLLLNACNLNGDPNSVTSNPIPTTHLSLKDSLQQIKSDSINSAHMRAIAKRDSIVQDSIQRAYW